jgi:hypothetical protein
MSRWPPILDRLMPWRFRPIVPLPDATPVTPRPCPGWPGAVAGVWHWRLPETPNGLRPVQSWHAIGSTPKGDIYVAGMDHLDNSALYRITAEDGLLHFLGDAKSSSQAAGNWRRGETAQKFHTRPIWIDGRVFVASMDHSTLDRGYLDRRGAHLYAYDEATDRFDDLSISEPRGVAARHVSFVTLTHDAGQQALYAASVPTAELYRYDLRLGRTTRLGRPGAFHAPYLYIGRIMWVDSRGRLYFTAGNPLFTPRDQPASIYGHVYFYDPETGFGECPDWRLAKPRALEAGQWSKDRKTCHFVDDKGEIYRFDDDGPRWSHLGRLDVGRDMVWSFHIDAAGTNAYIATSNWKHTAARLHEFDLLRGTSRTLCALADLSPELAVLSVHTGYDATDNRGCLHFTSFAEDMPQTLLVTRLDMPAVLAGLGLAP